jgi:hypothetical protein
LILTLDFGILDFLFAQFLFHLVIFLL